MAAYDPKRPRPSASTPTDDPAPVEALLDPVGAELADEAPDGADSSTDGTTDTVPGEDRSPRDSTIDDDDEHPPAEPAVVPGIMLNGSVVSETSSSIGPPSGAAVPGRTASEVPVAPAPASGTANRAVLIAAVVSSIVAALVVVLLARRRRH